MEFLKDNKFIKMEIKAIKMWKLIKYESNNFKHFLKVKKTFSHSGY